MTWETDEQRLCHLIRAGTTSASAASDNHEEFQGFAAVVDAFCAVEILEGAKPHRESYSGRRNIVLVSWTIPAAIAQNGISAAQRRWLLLRYFAAKFRVAPSNLFQPEEELFAGLAGNQSRIEQACIWLKDRGFLMWTPMYGGGVGRITDAGEEALERGLTDLGSNNGGQPTVQNYDNSVNIGTVNSTGGDVAIGPGAAINKEVLADELQKLITAIQQGPGSEADKRTALGHLNAALSHPLVVSIAGGLAGGLIGLL